MPGSLSPTAEKSPGRPKGDSKSAAGRLLFHVLLPAWGIPGLVDWWFHRRSGIEKPRRGGTHESALHLLMLGEGAVPVSLALLAEINPLALLLMAGSSFIHEATVYWDLTVASHSQREVTPGEQQVHSVLGAIPFVSVLLAALYAWPDMKGSAPSSWWRLRAKTVPLSPSYVAGVAALGAALGVLPHVEEFWRCARQARLEGRPQGPSARSAGGT